MPATTIRLAEAADAALILELVRALAAFERAADKVEATVDGDFLRQIRLGGFEEFCFDLDGVIVDEQSEIVVYAYDSYLNHSSETVHVATTAAANCMNNMPVGNAPRMPMCRPLAFRLRANSIVAGDIVNCV